MSNFFILRTEKIKSRSQFNASIKHHYRIGGLLNANEERTCLNYERFTPEESKERFESFFGKNGKFLKRRSDAVLAIDYLVTASPEFFINKTNEKIIEFLTMASDYIHKKHGEKNVLIETWELDETTPHLTIQVVPVDGNGKLNCKSFLGGKDKMRKLQDDFFNHMKIHFPELKRGEKVEKTRAKHTTLKEFYGKINQLEKNLHESLINFIDWDENKKNRFLFDMNSKLTELKADLEISENSLNEKEIIISMSTEIINALNNGNFLILNRPETQRFIMYLNEKYMYDNESVGAHPHTPTLACEAAWE